MRENEESLCEILDTVKQHNVHIVAVPKEEKEKEAESLLKEIMAEKLAKSGERDGYSPQVLKQIQHKEDITETHYNKTVKNQRPTEF